MCLKAFSHSGHYPLVCGVCLDKENQNLVPEYVDVKSELQTFVSRIRNKSVIQKTLEVSQHYEITGERRRKQSESTTFTEKEPAEQSLKQF